MVGDSGYKGVAPAYHHIPIKFPPMFMKIANSGGVVFVHPCCICGCKCAPFGYGVKFKGKEKTMGWWFCSDCKPKEEKDNEAGSGKTSDLFG